MSRVPGTRRRATPGVKWDDDSGEPLLVDPSDTKPFNPLDTKNLGIAVAKALLEKTPRQLHRVPAFNGAGIYVIYYCGPLPAYAPMAKANTLTDPRWPIYIGKAIPPGGRKGNFNLEATDTTALYSRLREHAESIQLASSSLRVSDFACRFLVVQDLWIPLAEQLLIAHFAPLWNRIIDGFGNHDPGAGRYKGLRPRWDVLHPGRAWAERCAARAETAEDIAREVEQYLGNATLPSLDLLHGDISGK